MLQISVLPLNQGLITISLFFSVLSVSRTTTFITKFQCAELLQVPQSFLWVQSAGSTFKADLFLPLMPMKNKYPNQEQVTSEELCHMYIRGKNIFTVTLGEPQLSNPAPLEYTDLLVAVKERDAWVERAEYQT